MPRIFAPNEDYNATQGAVDFVNGAAAVAADATEAIAYFTAEHYDIDTAKDALTAMDTLPRATINAIATYLGIALVQGDGKMDVINDIEDWISAIKWADAAYTLTVASTDGAVLGDSDIAITAPNPRLGTAFYYKTHATTAPAIRYMDKLPATGWTLITTGTDITATTGHKIAVVDVNAAGYVVSYGSDTIDSKDA